MLTAKQRQLLSYLKSRLDEAKVCPSYSEIASEFGLKSKSGVHRMVCGLEERGFIRRLKDRARSIEVLRMPGEGSAPKWALDRIEALEKEVQGLTIERDAADRRALFVSRAFPIGEAAE